MSEAEDNGQGQKPRISRLAIASTVIPIVVLAGWRLHVTLIRHSLICDGTFENTWGFLGFVLFWITLLSFPVGLILASHSSVKIKKSKGMLRGYVFSVFGAVLTVLAPFLALKISWPVIRNIAPVVVCQRNMQDIYFALSLYKSNWDGQYPPAEKWCDLLAGQKHMSQLPFECPKERKQPVFYIMNPNAEPNSPPDMVLLFEGGGERNEFGRADKLTLENHIPFGRGCNILFNDGHVEFVKAEEIGELKWKDEKGLKGEAEFPRELVEFAAYKGNPLFGGTGEDTWDRNIRERGFILREGDMYQMWYTGYNDERSDMKYLGYATSQDGFEWKRYEGNPIFTQRWVEDMFVVKHEGVYYMFAEGRGDIAHLLTSRDGVHWEDRGDLDVRYTTGERLSPGPYGTPTVLIEGDVWYLFYERDDLHVWLARSRDLKVWTNVQDEPVLSPGPEDYDGKLIAMDYIIRHEGRYYAYYHGIGRGPEGQEWGQWCASVAISADLVHWKKYPNNPIVIANSPILVDDGEVYRLYCMHPEVRVYFPR